MTVLPGDQGGSVPDIIAAVNRTGMRAEEWRAKTDPAREKPSWWSRNGRLTLTVASGLLTAVGFALHYSQAGGLSGVLGSEGMGRAGEVPWQARIPYLLAILAGIYYVLPKAWFALRSVRPDMNLLMTIAVCGAVAIGEWFEAATVSFLFSLSLTLESWSVHRARRAVEKLLDLSPDVVRVVENGQTRETLPDQVLVGTAFQVRPGERIPLDGEVIRGISKTLAMTAAMEYFFGVSSGMPYVRTSRRLQIRRRRVVAHTGAMGTRPTEPTRQECFSSFAIISFCDHRNYPLRDAMNRSGRDRLTFEDDFSDPALACFYEIRPGVGEISRGPSGLRYAIVHGIDGPHRLAII